MAFLVTCWHGLGSGSWYFPPSTTRLPPPSRAGQPRFPLPEPCWSLPVPAAQALPAPAIGFPHQPHSFDVSYGIYLWHWPLLVIGPFAFGHPLETAGKVGLFLAGIGLAWVTKVLIEDPLRTGALLRSNLRTYLIGAGAMATIVGLSFALTALAYAGEAVSTSARSQPATALVPSTRPIMRFRRDRSSGSGRHRLRKRRPGLCSGLPGRDHGT